MPAILVRFVFVMVVGASLFACTGKATRQTAHDEVPEGPGLLSGEDGEFVIFEH